MGAYADAAPQPQIMATNNAFEIVLPNANFTATEAKEPASNSMEASTASHSREDETLRFLAEHPSITRKEAQALFGVSQSTADRILKEMLGKGKSQHSAQAAPCDTNLRSVAPLGQLPKELAPALAYIVPSSTQARKADRPECNTTTARGDTGRINISNLAIEAKKQIEKTNRMMDQSAGRTRDNPFESEMRPTIE